MVGEGEGGQWGWRDVAVRKKERKGKGISAPATSEPLAARRSETHVRSANRQCAFPSAGRSVPVRLKAKAPDPSSKILHMIVSLLSFYTVSLETHQLALKR